MCIYACILIYHVIVSSGGDTGFVKCAQNVEPKIYTPIQEVKKVLDEVKDLHSINMKNRVYFYLYSE